MPETTKPSSKNIRILITIGKIVLNIFLSLFIIYIIFNYSTIAEIFIPSVFKFMTTPDWGNILVLCILLTALLCFKKYLALSMQRFFSSLTNKYFMLSLAVLAIAGASAALFVPSYTNWFRENDNTKTQQPVSTPQPTQSGQDTGNQQKQESKNPASELRGHLLYITGGVIAVLGLIETNRKNGQDHTREVHAARRDRYIEAVDKLSSAHAPVRLGGVYTLVGLVDEWLDDDNIDEEIRIEEGQIIINNLCAYIRSPFPLAETIEEYEAREELEQLSKKSESEKLNEKEFSRLQILIERFKDSDKYEKPEDITAEYAKFREEQDVRRSIFVEMSRRSGNIIRKNGKVIDIVPGFWGDFWFDFSRAPIFYSLNNLTIEEGSFSHIKFYADASFFETTFIRTADFSKANFAGTADFREADFADTAKFSGAKFNGANFSDVNFSSHAHFSGVTFTHKAIFVKTTFTGIASFGSTTFAGIANFSKATFTESAVFIGATFTGTTNFSKATFISSAPEFNDIHKRTKFSARMSPTKYIFTAEPGTITIERKPATLLDKTFMIPYGTVLFDPKSLDKKTGEYTRMSKPAK